VRVTSPSNEFDIVRVLADPSPRRGTLSRVMAVAETVVRLTDPPSTVTNE
jgi:hypothetical protein